MKLYKLTDKDGFTRRGEYNECRWGENVSHSGTGRGELCGPGFVHAYTSPYLAVLLNPIHANISNPRLWEATGDVSLSDRGLKVGCKTLTTVKELLVPEFSTEQRVHFALSCGVVVYKDRSAQAAWAAWAAWAADSPKFSLEKLAEASFLWKP